MDISRVEVELREAVERAEIVIAEVVREIEEEEGVRLDRIEHSSVNKPNQPPNPA